MDRCEQTRVEYPWRQKVPIFPFRAFQFQLRKPVIEQINLIIRVSSIIDCRRKPLTISSEMV